MIQKTHVLAERRHASSRILLALLALLVWTLGSTGTALARGEVSQGQPLTHSVDPAPNAAGWNNTDVTVTLRTQPNDANAAAPAGLGVGQISGFYQIDQGMMVFWGLPSTNFALTAEGVYTIRYGITYIVSNPNSVTDVSSTPLLSSLCLRPEAMSETQERSFLVRIDKTAPVTTAMRSGGSVTLSASDVGGSVVVATCYKLNGGMVGLYSGPIALAAGSNTLEFWSKDGADNEEVHQSLTIVRQRLRLVELSITPNPIHKNSTATATVRLNDVAPAGGVRVYLFSDRASVTVPTFVDIPEGQSSATFPVNSGKRVVRAGITANSEIGKKAVVLEVQDSTPV